MTETELFAAALDKATPEERAAYLGQACADDEELRRRVQALLQAHAGADEILDRPAASPSTGAYVPIAERPGAIVGPYKLLQQIGEGGFGVVFMAEQEKPVRRMVALKVIKPGMDTASVIARFESERQALALMDHPNIAKVLDAGETASGRPYFVMELVKGVPVTEFCDKNHMPAGQRLKLFIDVCHAIQHAHHKGVIHRDVKPSNVLVTLHDGVPVVKVIDFGVAKATVQKLTERTLFTAYGQMVGTPAYVSPEQAEMSGLDIDTRSDVYSLGVLLYELLTGTTPLESKRLRQAGYAEMQRLIREEEAPRPSTRLSSLGESATILAGNRGTDPKQLSRLLAGDLDWIVMKSLEKDRNRRYDTPGDFAADLERYLRHDEVVARPPSVGYKLAKFARRNRGAVATACAIGAALLIGTAIAAWQAIVATQAKRDALAALEKTDEARAQAQAKEAEANAVLKFFEDKVFAAGRPKGLHGGQGHDVSLREALQAGERALATSFKDQPRVEARLRFTLGATFSLLGEYPQFLKQSEMAYALSLKHFGPDDRNTLNCMNNVGKAHQDLGQLQEALRIHEETLAARKRVFPPDDPDVIQSMGALAETYAALDREDKALQLRQDVLAASTRVFGSNDAWTLGAMRSLADSHYHLGHYADALKLQAETLAIQQSVLPPDDVEIFGTMHNLANTYERMNRLDDALKLREKVVVAFERLYPPDSQRLLGSMINLAVSYDAMKRHADALKVYEKVLRGLNSLPDTAPMKILCLRNLACCYGDLHRHADAVKLQGELLTILKRAFPKDHSETILTMNNMSVQYFAMNRHADALKMGEEALAASHDLPEKHFAKVASMNTVAWALATAPDEKLRDPKRAVELAEKAVAGFPDSPDTQSTLGTARYRAGGWQGAIAPLEKAMSLRKPDDPANATEGFFLGMAHWQLGEKEKARAWFDKAVAWMKKNESPSDELKRFAGEAAQLLRVEMADSANHSK